MQVPTPLEQALATQSSKRSSDGSSPVHLVAVIASYIHHHDDPHLPAGQQTLLFAFMPSLSPPSHPHTLTSSFPHSLPFSHPPSLILLISYLSPSFLPSLTSSFLPSLTSLTPSLIPSSPHPRFLILSLSLSLPLPPSQPPYPPSLPSSLTPFIPHSLHPSLPSSLIPLLPPSSLYTFDLFPLLSSFPSGATRLLTRLSQVAPMSVFACLGSDAVSIRDAYVSRLGASVEVCVCVLLSITVTLFRHFSFPLSLLSTICLSPLLPSALHSSIHLFSFPLPLHPFIPSSLPPFILPPFL